MIELANSVFAVASAELRKNLWFYVTFVHDHHKEVYEGQVLRLYSNDLRNIVLPSVRIQAKAC